VRWGSRLQQALILLCVAAVPAALQAFYLRDRISWIHPPAANEMAVTEAAALGPAVMWIDARSEEEFAAGHVNGAMLLNAEQWDSLLPEVLNAWSPGKVVVVYCSKQTCGASLEIARRLHDEANLPDVFVLRGGWEAWQAWRK
jgi:Rhodanese-like domain.